MQLVKELIMFGSKRKWDVKSKRTKNGRYIVQIVDRETRKVKFNSIMLKSDADAKALEEWLR